MRERGPTDIIALIDRHGRHLWVNDAAIRVSGLPGESAIGRTLVDALAVSTRWHFALANAVVPAVLGFALAAAGYAVGSALA